MASNRSRDALGILVDHVKKTYENNAFPQAWRNLPEVPSSEEINPVIKDFTPPLQVQEPEEWNLYQHETFLYDPKLPHNIVDGPWPSKEAYLGAHYQIIREDAIASLRTAVAEVKHTPSMDENDESRIYTSVTFTGLVLSRIGVASRVEFSCERAGKRIRWDQSKRLVQGTIVALTPENDMFKTICKVATVAARKIEGGLDQDPPTIDLFWSDAKDIVFDPVEKYVMVESRSGYFEASRHAMVAMQKMMTERFSFAKELVDLDTSIEAPLYIQETPYKNLTYLEQSAQEAAGLSLLPSSDVSALSAVDMLNDFPKNLTCGMDQSQIQACKNMITKRLSIVQGPPGTGKTFVSISALEVIIRNLAPGDPPIIVAAQTNHALDQLLNHILAFEPEVVRIGGQSDRKNVAIKQRTFYELGKSTDTSEVKMGHGGSRREQQALCDELVGILSPLLNDSLLTANTLYEHGLITEGQRKSLDPGDWAVETSKDNVPTEELAAWLTESQLMKIAGAPPVNLGFPLEEGDIEAEQLRALENQAADSSSPDEKDTDFGLVGQWIPFGRKFTGRHSGFVADGAARKRLNRMQDMYSIPRSERGYFYRYFENQTNRIMMLRFQEFLRKYQRFVEDSQITKSMFNIKLMEHLGIKVVGCTTTGLSKYRGILSALKPRTLLIEEAAETLESKIIAGMFDSLQQLILVGDHKQLQASCTVRALQDEPYNLSISMFERLVDNGMPFVMLNHQRRMIPEVRKLLCIEPDPFYTDLHDHESVLDRVHNRLPVPGMGGRNAYFFSHNWMEQKTSEGSCFNLDEAKMIAEFYNYLVLNGVSAEKITVLTFYNGQRKTIIKQLKQHHGLQGIAYHNVFTVDSYQGEENDIILLSMVRSNAALGVGFLDNRNRLVVALSRARRGLYLFGNSITLTAGETTELGIGARDPLFDPLVMYMRSQGQYNIEGGLPITCTQHNSTTRLFDPDNWVHLAGGCQRRCEGGVLPCGHACVLLCHPFDHSRVICREACPRALPCGHGCSRNCGDTCVCDECQISEQTQVEIPGDLEWWGFDDRATSSTSSQSPTKSAIKSADSRGSGGRQVRFSEEPNPYTISDVRRNLPLTIDRLQTNSRRSTPFDAGYSTRRAFSDQTSGQPSRRTNSVKSTPSKGAFGRSINESQESALFRPYGQEPVIDKHHSGLKNWANYDAKKADREIDETQRLEVAKLPKPDPSSIMIKETYTPVVFGEDGGRIVDASARVRTRVNRAQANATTHVAAAKPNEVGSMVTTQVKSQQKKGLGGSRDKVKDTDSVREERKNKKTSKSSPSQASSQSSVSNRTDSSALNFKLPVKDAMKASSQREENKFRPASSYQTPQHAISYSGAALRGSSFAVGTEPPTVKTSTVAATIDLLDLLAVEEVTDPILVPVSIEQAGPWKSIIPESGAGIFNGDATVNYTQEAHDFTMAVEPGSPWQSVIPGSGARLSNGDAAIKPTHREDLGLLIGIEESLPQISSLSFNNLLDDFKNLTPVSGSVFDNSDDLISF